MERLQSEAKANHRSKNTETVANTRSLWSKKSETRRGKNKEEMGSPSSDVCGKRPNGYLNDSKLKIAGQRDPSWVVCQSDFLSV